MNKATKKRVAVDLLFATLCGALCTLYMVVTSYYDKMSIEPALQIGASIIIAAGSYMLHYDILHQM